MLYSCPPQYILLCRQYPLKTSFPSLPVKVFPLFPMKSTVSLQGVSINRMQILLIPTFAITEHKIQETTFKITILDFQYGNSTTGKSHGAFCSSYVQLSRLQSLHSMQLLQTISPIDIDNKPYLYFQQSNAKLDVLSRNTLGL